MYNTLFSYTLIHYNIYYLYILQLYFKYSFVVNNFIKQQIMLLDKIKRGEDR